MLNFHRLLEPYQIGKVKIRNRIIKTAAGTSFWQPGEHRVSDVGKAFYEAMARGGAGLVIVESPIVEYPFDEPKDVRLRIDDDRYIDDIGQLAQVIHKHGCPAFIQFYHRGPWFQPVAPNRPLIAASPVKPPASEFDVETGIPRELTVNEIKELTGSFVEITVRLSKAGFDGVEINAGCDHLFSRFLSRFWNKRKDLYGFETMENRSRFVTDIIRGIKKRLGDDFPVSVLINAAEGGMGEEGMTHDESKAIAIILQEAGADALHVRSHWLGHHTASYNHEHLFYPEPHIPIESFPKGIDWSHKWKGVNVPGAEAIRKVVSIPVITVSGIDPILGEEILRDGKADFIGMCRPLFADPELPNKLASGRYDDIAPCTRCSTCQKMDGLPKVCRVNAALGTVQYEIKEAKNKKSVVVIGGGPGGMEAARVAALRGHRVQLFEKAHKLGGSLPVAAVVKGLEIENLPALTRYLEKQIVKLGVKVKTGQEVDLPFIDEMKPDVLILATGGVPSIPEIPGINGPNVVKAAELHKTLKFFLRFFHPGTLRWFTKLWMPVGNKVVVIGGSVAACQLAEFLVKRGRKVTIVNSGPTLGDGLVPERRTRLFSWFHRKGVVMMTDVIYNKITDKGLTVTTKDGKKVILEADAIIPATPMLPNSDLARYFERKAPEIYLVGDCKEPRLIPDAIADGWRIGNII